MITFPFKRLLSVMMLLLSITALSRKIYAENVVQSISNIRGQGDMFYPRGNGAHDYAPAFMLDLDGKYKLWWCANFDGRERIIYSESSAVNSGWSTPQIALSPSDISGTFDESVVCDPAVIRVNGTYYMYYGGNRIVDRIDAGKTPPAIVGDGTEIGVAVSTDGYTWSRSNGGMPIVGPYEGMPTPLPSVAGDHKHYGAGQPSVTYVDGWFYLTFTDTTGPLDSRTGTTIGVYLTRSRNPLFPPDSSSEVYVYDELTGGSYFVDFLTFSANQSTMIYGGLGGGTLTSINNVDGAYLPETGEVVYDFFNWDRTKRLLYFFNLSDLDTITGSVSYSIDSSGARISAENSGILKDSWGRLLRRINNVGSGTCKIIFDAADSTVPTGTDLGSSLWTTVLDLSYSGVDITLRHPCPGANKTPIDFDNDRISDPAVYRPTDRMFYTKNSTTGVALHNVTVPNAVPISGDFDGDGISDAGVTYVVSSYRYWYINLSGGGHLYRPTWGLSSDKVAIADYDGDGRDDICAFRNGQWWIWYANNTQYMLTWGSGSDIPVPADYDGDGVDDLAVWSPSDDYKWKIKKSSGGTLTTPHWGNSASIAVQGDYTGDGKDDVAIWYAVNGYWWVLDLTDTSWHTYTSAQWGLNGDKPVVGDFNGDGRNDFTVWRPSEGNWYQNFRNGNSLVIQWGLPGDLIAKKSGN